MQEVVERRILHLIRFTNLEKFINNSTSSNPLISTYQKQSWMISRWECQVLIAQKSERWTDKLQSIELAAAHDGSETAS